MAHYAFLDENNIVTEVIVGKNEGEDGKSGEDWEAHYSAFRGQVCKKTSYNGNIRKNYAGIGFKYDAELDAFIPPQPFASWTFNNETVQWEPPVPMPNNGMYFWDENNQTWTEITNGS